MEADILSAVLSLVLLIVSSAIHETGHLFAAKLVGVPCRRMKFCAAGGVITFDFSCASYLSEAIVHLGGAVLGMASAVITYAVLGNSAAVYWGITVVLSVVNLLPIRGLDGGAALTAVLNMMFLPDTAERIAGWVSFITWTVLWCAVIRLGLRGNHELWPLVFVVSVMLIGNA